MAEKAIELELTPEQQEMIEKAIGRKSATLRLSLAELEERVMPIKYPRMG